MGSHLPHPSYKQRHVSADTTKHGLASSHKTTQPTTRNTSSDNAPWVRRARDDRHAAFLAGWLRIGLDAASAAEHLHTVDQLAARVASGKLTLRDADALVARCTGVSL